MKLMQPHNPNVSIVLSLDNIYQMLGSNPLSMKYLTASNEPHEQAWRKQGVTLLHQSVFSLWCHSGAIGFVPLSTYFLSVFSMLGEEEL